MKMLIALLSLFAAVSVPAAGNGVSSSAQDEVVAARVTRVRHLVHRHSKHHAPSCVPLGSSCNPDYEHCCEGSCMRGGLTFGCYLY